MPDSGLTAAPGTRPGVLSAVCRTRSREQRASKQADPPIPIVRLARRGSCHSCARGKFRFDCFTGQASERARGAGSRGTGSARPANAALPGRWKDDLALRRRGRDGTGSWIGSLPISAFPWQARLTGAPSARSRNCLGPTDHSQPGTYILASQHPDPRDQTGN